VGHILKLNIDHYFLHSGGSGGRGAVLWDKSSELFMAAGSNRTSFSYIPFMRGGFGFEQRGSKSFLISVFLDLL
jgi:hypothetical protein